MSATIATKQKVRTARDRLMAAGLPPTASNIIATIGGGSKTTVLGHLADLRAETNGIAENATVHDLAAPFLDELWSVTQRMAQEAAGRRYHSLILEKSDLTRTLEGVRGELQAAKDAFSIWERRCLEQEEELERLRAAGRLECSNLAKAEPSPVAAAHEDVGRDDPAPGKEGSDAIEALKPHTGTPTRPHEQHGEKQHSDHPQGRAAPFSRLAPLLELLADDQSHQWSATLARLKGAGQSAEAARKLRWYAKAQGYVYDEEDCLRITAKGSMKLRQIRSARAMATRVLALIEKEALP